MKIIVLITKATLSSEGPRNYALRLVSLLRGLGLDVNMDIILNNLFIILKVIYYAITKEINNYTFVKGIELLATFLAMPFATLDIIKIDAEGSEVMILKGAKNTLERFRPYIFIEVKQYNYNEFKNFIDSLSYRCESLITGSIDAR